VERNLARTRRQRTISMQQVRHPLFVIVTRRNVIEMSTVGMLKYAIDEKWHNTLGNDKKIYKTEKFNFDIDDLRHASKANNNLTLNFTEFYYVGKNACLEIVALDDGDLLESLIEYSNKENIWKL